MMRETNWNILNNLLLFKIWLLIRPFSRKDASAIPNTIPIAYVDVVNHNCDIVVDAAGDPLAHFKSPVTYSKNLLLIRYLFRKSIQTAYVDVANSKWDVVVVVDADGDL